MAEFKFPEEKNLVFIGEAGSGKTETAVNLALRMAREGGRRVHFFRYGPDEAAVPRARL